MTRKRKKTFAGFNPAGIEKDFQEVPNPEWSRDHDGAKANPRKIIAAVNVRESAITGMHARNIIDDAQARAAVRFRGLWETMGGRGAGAMDYTKEPVDGGGMPTTVTDSRIEAGKELARCRAYLGMRGYKLVCMVCGEGYQVSEVYTTKREQLSGMDALRGFLDDLAEMWNMKSRTSNRRGCAKTA